MLVHTKCTVTLIDIRAQRLDIHRLAFLHQLRNLSNLRKTASHKRSHIFGRIMRLHICRLVSHPGITGCMRFVESIGSKLFPVAPNFLKNGRIMTIFLTLLDELRLHRIYNILLLLTHRLTQGIRLTTSKVGKLTGKKHHLLLIDRDTIRILQILFHTWNIILDFFLSVLSGNKRWDIIHRSRTIERIHRNQVFKDRRLQLAQILLHTRRLKLESTNGLTTLIEFISQRIINRYCIQINIFT